MKKILFATTNPGKISEFKDFVYDIDVEVYSPDDLGIDIEVVEDKDTLENNAKKES